MLTQSFKTGKSTVLGVGYGVPHFDFTELSQDSISTRVTNTNLINTTVITTRIYIYTIQVIPTWNSLSDYVVSAEMVNTFKRRLNKFWSDQDVLYNYKADLHSIRNCIIIV